MEKKKLSEHLQGKRIYLKKHDESLAQTMYEYIVKDRERLARFLPWADFIKKPEDELNYIKMTHEKWEDGSLFDYGIFLKDEDLYIGNVGVHSILWAHDCAEIGYRIEKGQYRNTKTFSKLISDLQS